MNKVVFSWAVLGVALGILYPVNQAHAVLNAAPVTFAWDPADDATVRGYAVYYGPTNQPAANRIDTGMTTSATIFNLLANVTYRLYAVSYNSLGVESAPSNPVMFQQSAITRMKITKEPNASIKLTSSAAPGSVCTIQFTPTLQPAAWQTLKHTTADQAGNVIALDTSGSKAQSRFYRVVLGALPLLGRMQIQRQPDGNMLLTSKAPPGASCRVQYAATPSSTSSSPTSWLTLKTAVADAEGNVTALDTTARQATRRFYRMALP